MPLGYLGDAEKTARTFPVIDGVRYSVPGDRARYLADGEIELLGRDSVTINSGGEKIFAEEVEQAIIGHPAVADVVVAGRPCERWGSGGGGHRAAGRRGHGHRRGAPGRGGHPRGPLQAAQGLRLPARHRPLPRRARPTTAGPRSGPSKPEWKTASPRASTWSSATSTPTDYAAQPGPRAPGPPRRRPGHAGGRQPAPGRDELPMAVARRHPARGGRDRRLLRRTRPAARHHGPPLRALPPPEPGHPDRCAHHRPAGGVDQPPVTAEQTQPLRDWADFVHIRHIAAAAVPGYTQITPYENAAGHRSPLHAPLRDGLRRTRGHLPDHGRGPPGPPGRLPRRRVQAVGRLEGGRGPRSSTCNTFRLLGSPRSGSSDSSARPGPV